VSADTTWLVWEPDQGGTEEDAREVRATSAEQAACDYAEDVDADGYAILGGCSATFHVRKESGGPEQRFTVTGESVPQYTARALP